MQTIEIIIFLPKIIPTFIPGYEFKIIAHKDINFGGFNLIYSSMTRIIFLKVEIII